MLPKVGTRTYERKLQSTPSSMLVLRSPDPDSMAHARTCDHDRWLHAPLYTRYLALICITLRPLAFLRGLKIRWVHLGRCLMHTGR
jgi:hypothetical protein